MGAFHTSFLKTQDDKIMLEETSAIFAAVYTGFQTKTEKGRVQDVGFIFRS